MGTFSTVFESIERFGEEFDQNQAKLNLIVEYEMNNYDITQRQTALDLGTEESMVLEDALNVIEEASNRTVEKINKARQAGDNESKVYYNKIIQSLKKLNANGDPSDFNDIIRVSQQACKTYPALGKKEMTYDDYSGEVAVLQRAKTEANKMLTKAKRGKITKADAQRLKEARTEVNKDRKNKKNVVKKVVTVAAALALLATTVKVLSSTSKKNMAGNNLDKVDTLDPETAKYAFDWEAHGRALDKEIAAAQGKQAISIRNGLRKAVKSLRSGKFESVEEENYEDDFDFEDSYEESVTLQDIVEEVQLESAFSRYGVEEEDDEEYDESTSYLGMIDDLEMEFLGESVYPEEEFDPFDEFEEASFDFDDELEALINGEAVYEEAEDDFDDVADLTDDLDDEEDDDVDLGVDFDYDDI